MKNLRLFRNFVAAVMLTGVVIGFGEITDAKRRRPRDIVVEGEISALSKTDVEINGLRYRLTNRTKFEGFDDESVTLDAFAVGDCVKVKLVRGTKTGAVREMELEDDCREDDDDAPVGATPSPSPSATKTPGPTPSPGNGNCDDDGSHDDGRRNRHGH